METIRREEVEAQQRELAAQEHFFEADGFENNWEPFLSEVAKVGRVLYAANLGSRAFNLNFPDSDYDMIAIVVCSNGEMLRLQSPPQTVRNKSSFKPDFTVHELGYFAELLLSSDPRIVELLFQEESSAVFVSKEWRDIRALGKEFLTKSMIRKYISEIEGSKGVRLVKSLQGDKKFLEKKFYILFRLLNSIRLVLTGQFFVWFPDDHPQREFILSIRRGERELPALLQRFEEDYARLLVEVEAWNSPAEPNERPDLVENVVKWVFSVRGLSPERPDPVLLLATPRVYVHSPAHLLNPSLAMKTTIKTTTEGLELAELCNGLSKGDAKLVTAVFRLSPDTEHFQALLQNRDRLLAPRFLKGILRSLKFSLKDEAKGATLPDRQFLAELLHRGAVLNDLEDDKDWEFSVPNLPKLCEKYEHFDYDETIQSELLELLDDWQLSVRTSFFPL